MPSPAPAADTGLPNLSLANFDADDSGAMQHHCRRGFLRQLAALPLIGGSVTLLGRPIAAAGAVTPELLSNYNQWLWGEHCRCAKELESRFGITERFKHVDNAGAAFHAQPDWNWNANLAPASTRAAIVLAAVGCNWRDA